MMVRTDVKKTVKALIFYSDFKIVKFLKIFIILKETKNTLITNGLNIVKQSLIESTPHIN